DQVAQRSQLQSLDEGAALADGLLEFQRADRAELRPHALHHAQSVVHAAIEDDDALEFARVMLAEILGVIPQHGFNAMLLIVGWNEQQQAGLGLHHADQLTKSAGQGNSAGAAPALADYASGLSAYFSMAAMISSTFDGLASVGVSQMKPSCSSTWW